MDKAILYLGIPIALYVVLWAFGNLLVTLYAAWTKADPVLLQLKAAQKLDPEQCKLMSAMLVRVEVMPGRPMAAVSVRLGGERIDPQYIRDFLSSDAGGPGRLHPIRRQLYTLDRSRMTTAKQIDWNGKITHALVGLGLCELRRFEEGGPHASAWINGGEDVAAKVLLGELA